MPFQLDVVTVLIALTCAISAYAWSNDDFMQKWIMSPYRVQRNGEWYRFLTSGFLHADVMHLAFNMIAFYSFSLPVRFALFEQFGETGGLLAFLGLYLSGIVVSDIPSFLKHRDHPPYRSLGASGGVSSVMFASILLSPLNDLYLMFIPVPIPGFIFGTLYLIYSYYQAKRMGDNINHDAHFYGAVYGILLMLILIPGAAPEFLAQVSEYRPFSNDN